MANIILILATSGYLAYNPTLKNVAEYRTYMPVEKSLTVDYAEYECLIGLPYGYKDLIGKEFYFISLEGEVYGPWLAVDVESIVHKGQMQERKLVADIDCRQNVHKNGYLFYIAD